MKTLVGIEALPLFARATDPATSHRAAQDARGRAGAQRRQILAALTVHPMSNDQLDQMMNWRVGTASRRTAELVRLRLIDRTTATRLTRTGSAAFVFEVVR